MDEGSGEEEPERLRRVLQEQEYALQNLDEFVRNHKKVLDDYQKYRQTEDYQNSPACRLMETMKQICAANGYDDTFIPAMRKLSPLYNEHYEQLLKANEQFTKSYPEYLA